MKTRVLTAIFIFLFLVLFVLSSETLVFPIIISVLSFVSAYEVLKTFGFDKKLFPSIISYPIAVAMPVVAYLLKEQWMIFVCSLFACFFAGMLYIFVVCVFCHSGYKYSELSSMFMFLMYIVTAFSSMLYVRNYVLEVGFYVFVMIFVIAWLTDVFAYFTGYFFGKHKLCPTISPKKTIEGAVGGVIFSVIFALLFAFAFDLYDPAISVNYLSVAIFSPALSIISQIGDLFASVVKRERGIKDFGYLLPGHGGIVDRFDSILAIAGPMLAIALVYPMFTI